MSRGPLDVEDVPLLESSNESSAKKNSSLFTSSSSGIHLSATTLLFIVWAAYAFGGITIETFAQGRKTNWNGIFGKDEKNNRNVTLTGIENATFEVAYSRVEAASKMSDDEAPWPRPAWLMSFPNSGTSFTSYLILLSTKTKRATNYGERNLDENGNSVPVFDGDLDGPFWADPQQDKYTYPTRYVVTKTHCGGYCESCGPLMYVKSPYSFLHSCLSGHRTHVDHTGESQVLHATYAPEKIHRAIHLIRNPFDNVVSRYHLEQHEQIKRDGTVMPLTKEGFRDYCKQLRKDYKQDERDSPIWNKYIFDLLKDVPCHADFFRYIQWHNLAFISLNDFMKIPSYTLHYENFESRFNETAMEILDFLELEQVHDFPEFVPGKRYHEYFEEDEKARVKEAFRHMASIETWQSIERYFEDIEG